MIESLTKSHPQIADGRLDVGEQSQHPADMAKRDD